MSMQSRYGTVGAMKKPPANETPTEYLSRIGRKGGKVMSLRKRKALMKNLKKANQVRLRRGRKV